MMNVYKKWINKLYKCYKVTLIDSVQYVLKLHIGKDGEFCILCCRPVLDSSDNWNTRRVISINQMHVLASL